MTVTEDVNGVTFSFNGSITELDGFTSGGQFNNFSGSFTPQFLLVGEGNVEQWVGSITGPSNFGTLVGVKVATSNSGSPFSLQLLNPVSILLPNGYTLGSSISGSSSYAGETFSSMGITPGTYTWTLGNTAQDTITLNATAVPLETDALPVVVSAVFMAGGIWWKKKQAGAKVSDFIANK